LYTKNSLPYNFSQLERKGMMHQFTRIIKMMLPLVPIRGQHDANTNRETQENVCRDQVATDFKTTGPLYTKNCRYSVAFHRPSSAPLLNGFAWRIH